MILQNFKTKNRQPLQIKRGLNNPTFKLIKFPHYLLIQQPLTNDTTNHYTIPIQLGFPISNFHGTPVSPSSPSHGRRRRPFFFYYRLPIPSSKACSSFSKTRMKLLSLKSAVSTFSLIALSESRHLRRRKGEARSSRVVTPSSGEPNAAF